MRFIGYFKGQPTEYVIKYSSGHITREGPGLAFFYLKYNTQIVALPTSSMDANLVFNEVTSNFQAVTIQGQFTYRILSPRRTAELLNFTIDPVTRRYVSNDPERLAQRITNIIQMETRTEIQHRALEEVLSQYESIAARVRERIKNSGLMDPLCIELLSVYFVAAKPTPEVAKALEAEYRETLLRKADMAISARRAAAVEEERKIKENELNTEITLRARNEITFTTWTRSSLSLVRWCSCRRCLSSRHGKIEANFCSRARSSCIPTLWTTGGRVLKVISFRTLNRSTQPGKCIKRLTCIPSPRP